MNAYTEGRVAWDNGLAEDANPYEMNSSSYREWKNGYSSAKSYYYEQERIDWMFGKEEIMDDEFGDPDGF